jgi:hypothetical protein
MVHVPVNYAPRHESYATGSVSLGSSDKSRTDGQGAGYRSPLASHRTSRVRATPIAAAGPPPGSACAAHGPNRPRFHDPARLDDFSHDLTRRFARTRANCANRHDRTGASVLERRLLMPLSKGERIMTRVLGWGSVLVLLVAGCAGKGDGGQTGDDANVTAASAAIRVNGNTATRLVAAFERLELADHAPAGRVNVDVRSLSCLTSSNFALEEDDPLLQVPITTCTLDFVGQPNPHRELKDPPAKSGVLMDALAAIRQDLVEGATGKESAILKKVSCEGQGPSAGSDPAAPPPTNVTCSLESEGLGTIKVDGDKAKMLLLRIGAAVPDAVDHAMGGRFGVDLDSLECTRIMNGFIEETEPLFQIPVAKCTLSVQGKQVSVDDPEPKSFALRKALEKAGLRPDAAMGREGVTAASVSCQGSASQPVTCTLQP